MTLYWKIPVTIALRAPWVTPGDRAPGPSTDIVLARNTSGKFILPATLVKGCLRAATDTLVDEKVVDGASRDALFGTESGSRAGGGVAPMRIVRNEPERGQLIFSDLELRDTPTDEPGRRTQRVEIDPELGAAKEGHLLFVECPFDFGERVEFSGNLILTGRSVPGTTPISDDDTVELLRLALNRLFAVGGMKSVGFGRVLETSVGIAQPVGEASVKAPARNVSLSYRIDRPFVIDTIRHGGNLTIGSDVIPGAAIKAVLAEGFKAVNVTDADDFLAQAHISHAHPKGRRPLPFSLSLSRSESGVERVFDHLLSVSGLWHHRFRKDWKEGDENLVRKVLGGGWSSPEISQVGRSRTAIDSETLTSSYADGAGQLFAQIATDPQDLHWHGTIRMPEGGDRDLFDRLIALLKTGLPGLGKTGAVLWADDVLEARNIPDPGTDYLNLTLTSPACLFTAKDAHGTDARTLYEKYFDDIGFQLCAFFASQELRGGYLALRYAADPDTYAPWVLTSPGSVFRVRNNGGADIAGILNHGLPPAKGTSDDWKEFPFLRENGFGHVINDIVSHETLRAGMKLPADHGTEAPR